MTVFRPVPPPEPIVTIAGGIVRREYKIPAGMVLTAHIHDYDHLSILVSGHARLRCEDRVADMIAPYMVIIEKGKQHEILAIDDCVWDCLHAFELAKDDPLVMPKAMQGTEA